MNHPHTTRRMDNAEFIAHVMEHSKTGPMMQLFVIGALTTYAAQVQKQPVERLQEQLGQMIDAQSWLDAAKELQAAFDARFVDPQYQVEELDTDYLDDDQFYVRLLNENLQALRGAATNAVKDLGETGKYHSTIGMLRSALLYTGGAYVDELVRD